MKIWRIFALGAIGLAMLGTVACKSGSGVAGKKVKHPFTGSKYESNNKWLRASGQAVSVKQNIARSKADMDAKTQMAAQVGTSLRAVTDQYLGQTENEVGADVADKFQTLAREVMNTNLADLRKVGEEVYHNEETGKYTVYNAYEIKKKAMLRFMKKQAKVDKKLNDAARKAIDEILDEEIKKAED